MVPEVGQNLKLHDTVPGVHDKVPDVHDNVPEVARCPVGAELVPGGRTKCDYEVARVNHPN